MKTKNVVFGRHPVLEAFNAGKGFEKILLLKTSDSPELKEIASLARRAGTQVQYVPSQKLNSITGKNHQGVIAFISLIQYYDWQDVLAQAYDEGRSPLFLMLDHITDVGNFGAITRTALGCKVDAVIIPATGGAQINADAIRSSAGALNKMYICKVPDLVAIAKEFKANGIKLFASAMKGSKNSYELSMTDPTCIMMGAEHKGLSKELLELADASFKLPMSKELESFNVSVAAGMILYELQRQRELAAG